VPAEAPGLANPIATILSVAMMLEWLDHPEAHRGARLIRESVEKTMADPSNRTVDLGGTLSCQQMGDRVAETIGKAGV